MADRLSIMMSRFMSSLQVQYASNVSHYLQGLAPSNTPNPSLGHRSGRGKCQVARSSRQSLDLVFDMFAFP